MEEVKVKLEDPALVKYPLSRVERIEHRHQQRIMRVKVTNTLLEQKLQSQISHLDRKEKYYDTKHTEERKGIRADLLKIHHTDKSYSFLSPKHLIRLAQYYQEEEEAESKALTGGGQRDKRQVHVSPASLQKFNKVVGDIAETRDQQLHFNQVTCVHARAVHNLVKTKKKKGNHHGNNHGLESDSEEGSSENEDEEDNDDNNLYLKKRKGCCSKHKQMNLKMIQSK